MKDISLRINEEMAVYKNKENNKPKFKTEFDYSKSSVYETTIEINLHTGTHVDFPKHMIEGGKTSDDYELIDFFGRCYIQDMTYLTNKIGLKDVQALNMNSYDFVIFKTKNSFSDVYNKDFVYLDEEAAKYISQFDLKGIGIDALSIERNQPENPTHKHLLGNDILIFEGLDLSDVEEGVYEFFGVPLSISKVEAVPIRAFLK